MSPNDSKCEVPSGYAVFTHAVGLHPAVVAGFGKGSVDET